MEKIINIPLGKDGSQITGCLAAGFRGEHKATALVFLPDSELLSLIDATVSEGFEVVCRTDLALLSGEYFRGEERPSAQISEPFYLTAPMTLSGLDATVILSLIKKSEGKALSELFRARVKLCFEDSGLPYAAVPKSEPPCPDRTADFEQRVSEVTALMEGKTAAVKSLADRSAAQLSRVLEVADRLDRKATEVEEKLANGEFDGADGEDADLSLVSNALHGSAVGVEVEVDDISPLPHNILIKPSRNLLLGTSFTDVENTVYCRTDKVFPLVKGVSYTVRVVTKSGELPSTVAIENAAWTASSSPYASFGPTEDYTFEATSSGEGFAIFAKLPASEMVCAEIVANVEESLANLPITLNLGERDRVLFTDSLGTLSFPSSSSRLSASAGKLCSVSLSYNRDLNKAFPTTDQAYFPESENPQSGRAVAEAVSGKADKEHWERIDTITTTEDAKSFYVSKEPDGRPYCFKKMRVIITNASGGSGNAYLNMVNAQNEWTISYYLLNHSTVCADLWIEYGYLWMETHSGLGDYSQFHGASRPLLKDAIDNLRITGNGTILAGTTFEIWGVRA